jgi:type IV fimbrial biogenesis protein FimT
MVIVSTWAVPSYQQFIARNEVAAEVMRIRTALAIARNTAVTRRSTITVCPSPDLKTCSNYSWTAPLAIIQGEGKEPFSADSVLKVMRESELNSVTYRKDNKPVSYGNMGRSIGHNGTFRICGKNGEGAQVIVSNLGRIRITPQRPTCPRS